MQALAKLSVVPLLFRRACLYVGPALRLVAGRQAAETAYEEWSADCEGDSPFRVTDRLRRWTRVRHFMDAGTAIRHASATGGVVWERYCGPTGAVNWWSLTEEECEARAGEDWQPEMASNAIVASGENAARG